MPHALEQVEEAVGRVDVDEVGVHLVLEDVDDLLGEQEAVLIERHKRAITVKQRRTKTTSLPVKRRRVPHPISIRRSRENRVEERRGKLRCRIKRRILRRYTMPLGERSEWRCPRLWCQEPRRHLHTALCTLTRNCISKLIEPKLLVSCVKNNINEIFHAR